MKNASRDYQHQTCSDFNENCEPGPYATWLGAPGMYYCKKCFHPIKVNTKSYDLIEGEEADES